MPTIGHEFDKRRSGRDQVRRRDRRRCDQRGTKRSPPLKILMIKTLSMIMVCGRVDDYAKVNVRETGRRAARQQDAQSSHTHDRGAVRNQSAVAFPEEPDKRHVYTPLRWNHFTSFWLAGNEFLLTGCRSVPQV